MSQSIFEGDLEKVYLVKYMRYTNPLHHTVSSDIDEMCFIEVGDAFLVRESDLDKYRQYGGGYESIKYVGMMPTREWEENEEEPDRL